MRKFRLNKIFNAIIFTVLACTYQKRSKNFSSFMPWNNFQGFRVYAKTVKYKNIISLNILFNRNFRIKIIYLMYLILITWNKLMSDTFYCYSMV
jgi:hypothetical protein